MSAFPVTAAESSLSGQSDNPVAPNEVRSAEESSLTAIVGSRSIEPDQDAKLAIQDGNGRAFLVCLEKIGPFLKRGREGERNGEIYGTSAIYAGADYREAA